MCEEPMWGVALELEARINVPCSTGGGAAAEGKNEGASLAPVELLEEVYGPFSGQVRMCSLECGWIPPPKAPRAIDFLWSQ